MFIDSHLHVWDLSKAQYDWLGPSAGTLNRTFTFEDAHPTLQRVGVQGVVLVQAADNVADTQVMIDVADRHDSVLGVVAYLALDRPRDARVSLQRLLENDRVVGVRALTHTRPDSDWLLQRAVDQSLSALEATGLSLDIVTAHPRHLEVASIVADRHPDLRIVIDHLGRPPIGGTRHDFRAWSAQIDNLATHPLVFAKVSGLYNNVGSPRDWTPDGIRLFVIHALNAFGSDRLMFGGDWPVCQTAGGYERSLAAIEAVLDGLTHLERDSILGNSAAEFYRLGLE